MRIDKKTFFLFFSLFLMCVKALFIGVLFFIFSVAVNVLLMMYLCLSLYRNNLLIAY